jgi:hypothetical protein
LRREGQIYPIHRIAVKRDENSRKENCYQAKKKRKKCLPADGSDHFQYKRQISTKDDGCLFIFISKKKKNTLPGAKNIL